VAVHPPAGGASLTLPAPPAPKPYVVLEVLGLPAPQGSKTKMPNGAMVEAGSATGRANHRLWRTAVAETAHHAAAQYELAALDGPVVAELVFRFPMPASRTAAVRRAGIGPHAVKPDIDKIVRATLDGLVAGGVLRDDARVASLIAEKLEVDGWTGARIRLWRWT
jgi:Holliday junction resolvase RusA-like endonuclease